MRGIAQEAVHAATDEMVEVLDYQDDKEIGVIRGGDPNPAIYLGGAVFAEVVPYLLRRRKQ